MKSAVYRFEVVRSLEELAESGHLASWSKLAARSGALSGPEWYLPWIRAFGRRLKLHVVFCLEDQEDGSSRLAGVFPFHVIRKPWPLRVLRMLANDHLHRTELAIEPGAAARIVGEFLAFSRDRFAGIEIPGAPVESLAIKCFLADAETVLGGDAYACSTRWGEALCIGLDKSWNLRLESQSKNFRRQVRRSETAWNEQGLSHDVVRTEADLLARFTEIRAVSASSWQGKNGSGTFSADECAEFYREISIQAARSGRLRLDILRGRGIALGFVLSIEDRAHGRVEALKSEFSLDAADAHPGWQIFRRLAEDSGRDGFRVIDQGIYRTEFKERWSDRRERQLVLRVPGRGLAGSAFRLVFSILGRYRALKPDWVQGARLQLPRP